MSAKDIFHPARDHYLMFHVGWRGERRMFGYVINIEMRIIELSN